MENEISTDAPELRTHNRFKEDDMDMLPYYTRFTMEVDGKGEEQQFQKAFELALEINVVPLTKVKLNRENWNMLFPGGFVETPIGTVKLGENQFEKLQKSDRNYLLGAMYETLSNPAIVLEKETLDKNFEEFKPVNVYGKSFMREDSNHNLITESIVIFRDGEEISISTHNKEIGRFTRQIKTADQIIYADPEISRVASLILQNGGSHVQLKGINAQALNKDYNKNNILSIKDLHFSNEDETLDLADEVEHISKENKEMETKQNEESSNLITPKEYLKNLLSKAEIEVVEDTGVMRMILDEGKRVQKMAAKYGTSQDIDGEENFNGFGTYVVSVNEENARQLGIKIASKRYGGSFYINGEPFNEFLKEKNFSPYWESRLDQFKDHNVEYLADDFLRADVKGNTALEKERDTLTTLFSLGLVEYKREQAFLYSVDIPDNDSTNYLLYGNPIGIENANRINERLERMNVEWRVTRNDIGKNVYFNTLSEKVFGGSQESASKFLKEAGYVGMEMNSANYIVFDDKDMKVTNRVQYMIDGDSNVYGFAYDGKIYADPEIATSNTYAHEYTHLWDAYTQRTNPELWEKGKDIFKGTSLWNEVMTDENYQNLSNDDEILSECHSRIVGKMAERVLERIAERNGGILRDQVIDWDNEVAEYVASELGAEFPKPELESENYISDSARLEIAREFLSQPMKDLMEGRRIGVEVEKSELYKENEAELKFIVEEMMEETLPGLSKLAESVENEEEDIASTRKTVKASEIFKDFEESMIFSGISQKDFDSAMLDYLHQRSAKEEAENGSFDTQDLMFDFLVAQKIHDETARNFALDKIEQYKGMTVEFDADNIDLGYLSLSDREGAKEVEKELEELKVAHPTLVKNLSIENPFLSANPEQVQELQEQAEAVEKMQQEAALTVEFDENGNPYYPKNEVVEEPLQNKYSDEMDKGIEENAKFFESIKKYFEDGVNPIYNEFKISETPPILQYAGVPNHEIVITTKILNKAKNATHNLDNEEILSALKGLSNPIIIFDSDKEKSEAKGNSVLIFTEGIDRNNKPLAIGFEMGTQKQGLKENYIVNQIHSIHPRTTLINSKGENMLEKWTEKGLIKYVDDKKISEWLKDRQVQFPLSLANPDEITVTDSENTVKHFPVKTRTGFDDKKISDWSKAAGVQSPLAVLQSDDSNILRKSDIVNNQNDFQKNSDEIDKGIEKIYNLQEKSTDEVQQNEGSPVQTAAEQQTANPDEKKQDIAQTVDKDILPAFALVTKDGLKMFEGYRVQGFDNETGKYTVGNERGDSIRLDESTVESIRNPQNTIAAEKEKSVEAVQTQGAIVAGKTSVPEFAMITQNGLKEFKDMVVQKYSPSEKMWTLSNAEGEKVSVSENTFKELTSENQRSRAREFDENTPAYKKMLETQYNDYFKQRENTAANFIHNLSVYSRKEANSPIDAIRLSSVIIKQMSPGEKQKTKELLNTLCKDGETINGLIANTYLEAVKDKPLNEEYILSGRYKDTIARPMYDTISAKGEKVDNKFNLRIGDTVSNVSFKAKKTFGVGSEKMVADWTVISASKQGNLITLKSGNSFRDVPRDTFLKQYSKQEKNEQKQQVKERKRNTLNMDIER